MTSYYTKRAVQGTGGPIGEPQPVRWIDCGCGTCVPVGGTVDEPEDGAYCNTCGTSYDGRGWIIERHTCTCGICKECIEQRLFEIRAYCD